MNWTCSSHCEDRKYMQNRDVETRRKAATSEIWKDMEGKH
jgi:hypothetical protein